MTTSLLFDGISDWLLDRALHDSDLQETVRSMGRRLVAGGVPVCRINVGGLLLHPVLGALDLTWEIENDVCRSRAVPRAVAKSEEFRNAPFYALLKQQIGFARFRLCEATARSRFPLLETLASCGVTDYLTLYESYGRDEALEWADLPAGAEGALVSFATRRMSGFSAHDVAGLKSLSVPIAIVAKMASDRNLAEVLLETYLGSISGHKVLSGLVEKGDGQMIDCALWFSDFRGSTVLSTEVDIDAYFATINDYFECTAGAVIEHGGEVLKFMGDGVMAIFPFEEGARPTSQMCMAAAMTAREALARAEARNRLRAEQDLRPIAFGIGLHAGRVIYGNVGTEKRLDLTVTGPAANEVARLEALTKCLDTPVAVSRSFADLHEDELVFLGVHEAPGLGEGVEVFTLPALGRVSGDVISCEREDRAGGLDDLLDGVRPAT